MKGSVKSSVGELWGILHKFSPLSSSAGLEQADGESEMNQSQSLMQQHYSTSESSSAPVSRHGPIFGVEEDPAGGDHGPATSNRKSVEYRSGHDEPELVVQRGPLLQPHFLAAVFVQKRCCFVRCLKRQTLTTGSTRNPSEPPPSAYTEVTSLDELEEVVEECNSIELCASATVAREIFYFGLAATGRLEKTTRKKKSSEEEFAAGFEVTEAVIELLMRIEQDRVVFVSQEENVVGVNAKKFLVCALACAWYRNVPNLVKLVVGLMSPSELCPMSPFVNKAAIVSALMNCNTMLQLLKLLLELNAHLLDLEEDSAGDSWVSVSWLLSRTARTRPAHSFLMPQQYTPSFLLAEQATKEFRRMILLVYYPFQVLRWTLLGPMYRMTNRFCTGRNPSQVAIVLARATDVLQCYSDKVHSEHSLTNLPSCRQWKLDAHVTGLRSPWTSSKKSNQQQLLQNIQLQVLMEPTVLPNCSLTLKILSLEFQNLDAANCRDSSSSILRRFFLSRVAVTVTPEVEPQQVLLTRFELDSPNPVYDRLFVPSSGSPVTVPLGKGRGGNMVRTTTASSQTTSSLTSGKLGETDWHHEQTHGTEHCHSSKSGTFSWTLKNLGGIPFSDRLINQVSSYTMMSRSFKKTRSSWSDLSTGSFDADGGVTFTHQQYPDTITWMLAPELLGTMVAWRISMEVHVSILNKCTGFFSEARTLKFCFASHLQHELTPSQT